MGLWGRVSCVKDEWGHGMCLEGWSHGLCLGQLGPSGAMVLCQGWVGPWVGSWYVSRKAEWGHGLCLGWVGPCGVMVCV